MISVRDFGACQGVPTPAVELGGGLTPLSDGVSGRNLIGNTESIWNYLGKRRF